jgi:hypothetical protein
VHVVGGDGEDLPALREPVQRVVALVVVRVTVVGQLHRHVAGAEQVDQPVQLPGGRRHPAGGQRPWHGPFPAAGQHHHVGAQGGGEVLQVAVGGLALLLAGELALRDGAAQRRVPVRAARQHQQVPPLRVGLAVLRFAQVERELGAEDRG